jgi:hypothetical protein
MFCGINPNVLWFDEGIASFNYVSVGQPLWISYHYIIEALKTQSPTVIVLDMYFAYRHYENGYGGNQQGFLSTFPISANKLYMIGAGIEPKERISSIIDLLFFHTRWRDIDKESLPYAEQAYVEKSDLRFNGYWIGNFTVADISFDNNSSTYPSTVELDEIHEKNLFYLMKIIELAKDRDIELLLIKTPNAVAFEHEEEQRAYNTVMTIAAENHISFIDFNKDEHRLSMGFDFTTDMWDDNHLNVSGAEKLSKYIAEHLKTNYDLPDRRGNPAYSSWDETAASYFAYEAVERARIKAEQEEEEDTQ